VCHISEDTFLLLYGRGKRGKYPKGVRNYVKKFQNPVQRQIIDKVCTVIVSEEKHFHA
jgi:hypothetical protein